ncbi:hypothetical protein QMO56_21950 [Roseomonas sp. E05]|nr:hypothetical protein [Roseomonas sp. E05]MDJ0390783.1 hypothetical protein [Roseomonas sp. E05]
MPGEAWLRRGLGNVPPVIGVTAGTRFEAERMAVLMPEPLTMQASGRLP